MKEVILLTGGTGFVGGHLLALLQKTHPQAEFHLTAHRQRESSASVNIHTLNLDDATAFSQLLQKINPTHIYHLAAIANVALSFQQPATVVENNFRLTLNLLETARKLKNPPKILLISSSDLYAPSSQPLSELSLVKPGSPYAASKVMQDALGVSYAKSFALPVIIARPFNHIGPGQKPGFVVADFVQMIVEAEKKQQPGELLVGNLSSARDFTDVRDVVAAYELLMNKGQPGEIYNIGSGRPMVIEEILQQLVALAKVPLQIKVDQQKFRPVDVPVVTADCRKLQALGWQPSIPLADTLAHTLEAARHSQH
mgnify:CR=1 FL=1